MISYNLIDQAWIPCLGRDGVWVNLGLRETLTKADALRELSGDSPLVTAALYRLLLAMLHRVFGPDGYDAWHHLWQAGRFDETRLTAYLEQWRGRFDLFDATHPFYQAADERVKPKPVNSLVLELAFGNKATLFDHTTDAESVSLTPAEGARAVVSAQSFGLAGLSGLPQKFTDGASARGVTFLVQGETLFETLMLNLLRYPTDDDIMPHYPADQPAWEMDDPFTPDRSRPRGYLDYLTWQNRRVLLMPVETPAGVVVQQMTLAPGLRLDNDRLNPVLDPMKHYRKDEKLGYLVQRFNEDRALWRDSAALFKLHDKSCRPPRVFQWLAELIDNNYLKQAQTRRYLALGMANNQAKVDFYRAEHCPLPLPYLTEPTLVERLDEALKMAEGARSQLWGAGRTLASLLLSPESDTETGHKPHPDDLNRLTDQWAIERDYWSRLEIPFRQILETLPNDIEGGLTHWRKILYQTAWSAFNRVARDLERDPRQLKATVRAGDQLAMGLAKVLPENKDTPTTLSGVEGQR